MNSPARRDHLTTTSATCRARTAPCDGLDHADGGAVLTVVLSKEQLEALAGRVADLIQPDEGFLDVDGAARVLGGCSRKAVYHLVERDRIRCHRLAGRLLFDPAELRADVERGE